MCRCLPFTDFISLFTEKRDKVLRSKIFPAIDKVLADHTNGKWKRIVCPDLERLGVQNPDRRTAFIRATGKMRKGEGADKHFIQIFYWLYISQRKFKNCEVEFNRVCHALWGCSFAERYQEVHSKSLRSRLDECRIASADDAQETVQPPKNIDADDPLTRRLTDRMRALAADAVDHPVVGTALDFINENDSGFWLLTAGPGMGKSVLMASIAMRLKERADVIYFPFIQFGSPLTDNTQRSFSNYVLRRIEALKGEEDEAVRAQQDARAEIEYALAHASCSARPLVIVVDALDEMSGYDPRGRLSPSMLGLPTVLPENVYVMMSVRHGDAGRSTTQMFQFGEPFVRIDLHDGTAKDDHRETVVRFVREVCQDERRAVARLYKHNGDAFALERAEDADFNFMLLQCQLFDDDYWARGGTGKELPNDLIEYYQWHFDKMTSTYSDGLERDAVFCFAIMPELSEIMFEKLLAATHDPERRQASRVAIEQWRNQRFLEADNRDEIIWLRPYHRTYSEFLEETFKSEGPVRISRTFMARLVADDRFSETIDVEVKSS